MRVIEHGSINRSIVCGSCGAKLEYENGDIVQEPTINTLTAQPAPHCYVVCPDCGAKIYILGLSYYVLPHCEKADSDSTRKFDPDWNQFTCRSNDNE